jgi:hypothetical protein
LCCLLKFEIQKSASKEYGKRARVAAHPEKILLDNPEDL